MQTNWDKAGSWCTATPSRRWKSLAKIRSPGDGLSELSPGALSEMLRRLREENFPWQRRQCPMARARPVPGQSNVNSQQEAWQLCRYLRSSAELFSQCPEPVGKYTLVPWEEGLRCWAQLDIQPLGSSLVQEFQMSPQGWNFVPALERSCAHTIHP